MKLTSRAKGLLLMAAIATFGAMGPMRTASADESGYAILGWLTGILGPWMIAIQTWAVDMLGKYYIHKGNAAITQQVAANTLGVQSALQANAATGVEATSTQTQKLLENTYKMTFGKLGTYGNLTIGSNAPFSCRRKAEAEVLTAAKEQMPRLLEAAATSAERHDKGYGSPAGAMLQMQKDAKQYGTGVFALEWLSGDTIEPDKLSNTWRSINYLTNPDPLPEPASNAQSTMVGREYALEWERHRQLMALPQRVLARQAALRAAIPNDPEGRSYLSTLEGSAKAGVEDPQHPVALQIKTEAGVMRDVALSLQTLTALESERLRTEQETAALTAILVARQLQTDGEKLREKHADMVIGGGG